MRRAGRGIETSGGQENAAMAPPARPMRRDLCATPTAGSSAPDAAAPRFSGPKTGWSVRSRRGLNFQDLAVETAPERESKLPCSTSMRQLAAVPLWFVVGGKIP